MNSAIAYKDLEDMDLLVGKVSALTGLTEQNITERIHGSNIKMFDFENSILLCTKADLKKDKFKKKFVELIY